MAKKSKSQLLSVSVTACENRKARYDFQIEEEYIAGIMLTGTEVKSLRTGQGQLADAYAAWDENAQLVLLNCYIPPYNKASHKMNHEPRRNRVLLLTKREQNRLQGKIEAKGYTLIPLNIHFNAKGVAKVTLALAKGKSNYDKRASEKDKAWKRERKTILEG
jgi:SsrA-binding protein